jgi:Co/Zn/Cd efflux system component
VALAVCVVAWSISDPVVAVIISIAVLTSAAIAVWSGRKCCGDAHGRPRSTT